MGLRAILKKLGILRLIGHARKDHLLGLELPRVYRKYCNQPVDPNKVLFVEYRSAEITDSLRLLYDAVKDEKAVHTHFLRSGFTHWKPFRKASIELVKDAATASVIFLDDTNDVISCLPLRPETKVIQVWHACGAFKKFGMSTADLKFGQDRKYQQRHPGYANLSCVTVSSPEVAWAYEEAMNLKDHPEVIKALGVSRTDVFFDQEKIRRGREKLEQAFPAAAGKKVILYAPTFRGGVSDAYAPSLDYEMLYKLLGKDTVVVTKHHPFVRSLPVLPEKLNGSFVWDATGKMEIEDLLFAADICISDYSSLVFEYSLLDRPMLFYAPDLDDYYDWRGFYYDYQDMTPGRVCKNMEELAEELTGLEQNRDKALQEVAAFREKFMSACDGHSTERILQEAFQK